MHGTQAAPRVASARRQAKQTSPRNRASSGGARPDSHSAATPRYRTFVSPRLPLCEAICPYSTQPSPFEGSRVAVGHQTRDDGDVTDHAENARFENDVRRVARGLWPGGAYGGAAMLAGRESDGLFVDDDRINLIECATSRRRDKAQHDGAKLKKTVASLQRQYPTHVVRGWFITFDEPTAEQRAVIANLKTPQVTCMSFEQFRSRLIDAAGYLDLRALHPWGSARDPDHDSYVEVKDYVPLGLVDMSDAVMWDIPRVADALAEGNAIVFLGDYGAGKSMTMRELAHYLTARYKLRQISRFPVSLNLREHQGQADPVEALERHARNIGFARPDHLVRAWRSGDVVLLLDGFDEMASLNWSARAPGQLQGARHKAVALVRGFVQNKPAGTGIAIAGRTHYFDSRVERLLALGLAKCRELSLSDFTADQVGAFLERHGWRHAIPPWLPSRPLLLGYLASRGLLEETLEVDEASSPATGWNGLLDRIAHREARLDLAIDGDTVRRILEAIATMARGTPDGLGPLDFSDIEHAFRHTVGREPDDDSQVLLQRLPGLGVAGEDSRQRVFVDETLADVARAGAPAGFALDQYGFSAALSPERWQVSVDAIGAETCALGLGALDVPDGQIRAALRTAASREWYSLAADLVLVLASLDSDLGTEHVRDSCSSGGESGVFGRLVGRLMGAGRWPALAAI